MNGQIEIDPDRRDNFDEMNNHKGVTRSSKRFVASKLMERLVPVVLLILAVALIGTILLVVLSSIKL